MLNVYILQNHSPDFLCRNFKILSHLKLAVNDLNKTILKISKRFHSLSIASIQQISYHFFRTPAKLLHEVVLVDDKSELEHLHQPLEDEIKKPYYQGKIKLVRNKQREGLIRARNNGAIAASGDVVVFLDAHCEVGPNWLPPLLTPIYDNPKTLTVPVIDGIQWSDFSINPVYAEGAHSRGK